jgi:hypothetical protein
MENQILLDIIFFIIKLHLSKPMQQFQSQNRQQQNTSQGYEAFLDFNRIDEVPSKYPRA